MEPEFSLRALVVGEALIDIVSSEDRDVRVPGGSPMNVAVGLARLGVGTTLLTCIADDDDGQLIVNHLERDSVTLHPDSFGSGRTPTARATLGDDGQPKYEFDVSWQLPDAEDIDIPDIVHVGSYSAFMSPGAEQVYRLLERARSHGAFVTLDPNVREELMPSHAESKLAFERLAARADVVKMSDEDASWLYPSDSLDAVVHRAEQLGVGVVAVTQGGDGSVVASHGYRAQVAAHPTYVVDTIGAGDSYMSALIDFLARRGFGRNIDEKTLRESAQRSARAAAITVGRRGADPPRHAELAAWA